MKTEILPEEDRIARQVKATAPRTRQGDDLPDYTKLHGKPAPKTTDEAAKFLRAQHDQKRNWHRLCLKLQRTARGIPAAAPTALSASLLTPESERIKKISDLRRGMVAYCDDPKDSNPAGHIFFIAGRSKDGTILTWTNDAAGPGVVSVVPISFYRTNWGDSFQFGATWLNGYDFSDFNVAPKPVDPSYEYLGDRYEKVIEDLKAIQRDKEKRGATKVAAAVGRDIALLERKRNFWDISKSRKH